jgi:hypothetical protein
MEKEKLYKKVYIRSEADLPKEDGIYFVAKKDSLKSNWLKPLIFTIISKNEWLNTIDWYLQPFEDKQPEQTLPMECRTCKVIQGHLDGC